MKNRVFITGVNGFLGKNLKNYLSSSFEIKYSKKKINYREINDSPYDLKNIDTVIHCAGLAHVNDHKTSYEDFYHSNVLLTEKTFIEAKQKLVKNFIFISSVSVYDSEKEKTFIDQNTTENPSTNYGKSKLEAERVLKKLQINSSINLYIIRPAMIIGKNSPGNLKKLNKLINFNLPFIVTRKKNLRSFLSISSFCDFIKKLINSNKTSTTFLLANNKSLNLDEILELLRENKKSFLPDLILPYDLIKLVLKTLGKKKEFYKLFGSLEIKPSENCFLKGIEWNPEIDWKEEFKSLY
jgi:UDP-glucose 4-epimerase